MRQLYYVIKICLSLFIIITVAINICLAAANKNPTYILLTGFEPFGGEKVNSSWESIRHLQSKQIANKTIIVAELPVVWEAAGKQLGELIQKYHPLAVIAFGEEGAEPVQIELVAHNIRQNISDNHGALPRSVWVAKNAPAEINSTLNVPVILKYLHEAGIPAAESHDAGGYLCNETFYLLMANPDAKALNIPRGFVHVPPLNASVKDDAGHIVLFDLKTLERTADLVVRAVLDNLAQHGMN